MRGSGTSLSRFELENAGLRNELPVGRENAGLRNELDPFWACKCESPELPRRVWLALSGRLLTRGAAERFASVRAEPAGRGRRRERVEIKEILKMVMLRNRFFLVIY